ncbi:MAG: fibronectin type III domain-containing protein [Nitrospirae bacterium]|nr:fibronectin type III domain-containing protein [Nitrospirota bacterium]
MRRQVRCGRQAGRQFRSLAGTAAAGAVAALVLATCGGSGGKKGGAGDEAALSGDSVTVTVAIPLTPEQATALAGVSTVNDLSSTEDLVMDIFANDEVLAEGVGGGLRAAVRGGVRAGVRAVAQRVAPPASSPRAAGAPREAKSNEADDAVSFAATFSFPREKAREGANSVVARVRPKDRREVHLVEVRKEVNVKKGHDPGAAGKSEPAIEVEDADIRTDEVVLPDSDGDGVATLLEVVSLGVPAALNAKVKPTEEQVKAAIEQLASRLIEEMKRQGLVLAVDISKIDLTPPQVGIGFSAGEATVTGLPPCEPGSATPATDTVESAETGATFVLCANEPAGFKCSLDGAPFSSYQTPVYFGDLEPGRHSIVLTASDGNGNNADTPVSFRWRVLAPGDSPGQSSATDQSAGGNGPGSAGLAAPTGLTVTAGNGGVTLAWNAVAGATGYKVYHGTSSSNLSQWALSSEANATVGGLTNGTTHYFAVAGTAGSVESAKSDVVSATPSGASQGVVLSAPAGVAVTVGDGQVTISWTTVAGASSYKVYFGTSPSALTSTAAGSTTSAAISDLTNGTTYYFAVAAVSGSAESSKSAIVAGTPTAVADTTPPVFAGLAFATAVSSGQIDLSWSAATDNVSASSAITYRICQSVTSGTCATSFTATYTTVAGATSYSVTGLTGGTTYHFLARSVDVSGNQDTNGIERSATTQQVSNSWATKAAMPTGIYGLAAVAVNGRIYLIGGGAAGGVQLATNEEYDPVADAWATKAPMPTARRALGATLANGRIYAIGGMGTGSTLLATNEEYDPVANTWSTKAAMPTGRFALAVTSANGKVYAIGGSVNGGPFSSTNEEYDPVANSWVTKAPRPTASYNLVAAAANGKIYAIGGYIQGYVATNVNEMYDPNTNTWTARASMPTARYGCTETVAGGKIYVIGGDDGASYLAVNEEFDPATNAWSSLAAMPTARAYAAAAEEGGRIYVLGGAATGVLQVANEEYTPP